MIRATIVLLIAHAVIPRLRRASAAERHLLWVAAMATAAMLPGVALIMPAWRPIWATTLMDALPASLATLSWALPRSPDVVLRATGVESTAWTTAHWLGAIWIVGSATVLLRLAAEVKLRRLMATSCAVTDARVLHLLRETASALGLERAPHLLRSAHALVPLTWGFLRPRVLLPDEARDWEERLRAVLAHELAHVRRGDWFVHLSAQFACAVYWFHPLFWTAERALGRESEHAADDEVLGIGLDGSVCAYLLDIVRAARTAMPPRRTVVAMARTPHLERRITALLDVTMNRGPRSTRAVMVAGALAMILTPPIAAMTIEPSALYMDVVVQMLDLPPVTAIVEVQGPDPMQPSVRHVTNDAAATDRSIVAPTIAGTTPALCSDQARRHRAEGVVTVALHVDDRGRVTNARVVKGLGDGLDQNALVAGRQWRFQPGTSDGRPVAMDAEVDIEFNLRTEAINELIANDMVTLVGPGVTPPRVVRMTGMPVRISGARGTVLLDVVLLENGSPRSCAFCDRSRPKPTKAPCVTSSSGVSAALRNGVPVKVRMNAEVRFHG